MSNLGKKVRDVSELVDVFEAQEGEIYQIIGKTGNGKTYEGTRRALDYLRQGYVVYTTWDMILPDFYDERENKEAVLMKLMFWKSRFFRFNYRKNWRKLDIDRPDLIEFVAGLTDCIVFLDEGQDIFDSRERIDKSSRKTLTRTRHMRKTLIIISQRAQAVDVTARANVTFFYKCVKTRAWWWPFLPFFKVYRTEEMDNQNYPIWEDYLSGWKAELWHSGFARQYVFDAFNSWYLRAGIPKSQTVDFEAFDLSFWEKLKLLFARKKPDNEKHLSAIERINAQNKEKYGKIVVKDEMELSTGYPQVQKDDIIKPCLDLSKKPVTVPIKRVGIKT